MFSLGCTIAELWLDGEGLLDLPGMVRYRAGSTAGMDRLDHEDSPARGCVNRIGSGLVRQVVVDMTQIDPMKRKSVEQYRRVFEGNLDLVTGASASHDDSSSSNDDCHSTVFPAYFRDSLYPLFMQLHWQGVTPDDRIGIICQNYSQLLSSITGCAHGRSARFFSNAMSGIGLNSQSELMHTSLARVEAEKIEAGDEAVARRVAYSLDQTSLLSARQRRDSEYRELLSPKAEASVSSSAGVGTESASKEERSASAS